MRKGYATQIFISLHLYLTLLGKLRDCLFLCLLPSNPHPKINSGFCGRRALVSGTFTYRTKPWSWWDVSIVKMFVMQTEGLEIQSQHPHSCQLAVWPLVISTNSGLRERICLSIHIVNGHQLLASALRCTHMQMQLHTHMNYTLTCICMSTMIIINTTVSIFLGTNILSILNPF